MQKLLSALLMVPFLAHAMQPPGLSQKKQSCEARAGAATDVLEVREVKAYFDTVFQVADTDREILIMVDLPPKNDAVKMDDFWRARVGQCSRMTEQLKNIYPKKNVQLAFYQSTFTHGGDLPGEAYLADSPILNLPYTVEEAQGSFKTVDFQSLIRQSQIVFAPTAFSATGPLQRAVRDPARRKKGEPLRVNALKGISAIGWNPALYPAVRKITKSYSELARIKQKFLKAFRNAASMRIEFETKRDVQGFGRKFTLNIDLRGKKLLSEPMISPTGGVDNVIPGEAWIVPVDGAKGLPSETEGDWPVQINGETVLFYVEANQILEVLTEGPESNKERANLESEARAPGQGPNAIANVAELGFGFLEALGFEALPRANPSSTVANEKLAIHIANGLNAYWADGGGNIGHDQFRNPQNARHRDHVYHRSMQPLIRIKTATLIRKDGSLQTIVSGGKYDPSLL